MRTFHLAILLTILAAFPGFADTVTGTVLGPDGKPVEGAEVYVEVFNKAGDLVTTATDREGRFSVDVDVELRPGGAVGRGLVLAPGYALTGGSFQADNTTRLEPAGQLWGTVEDEQGKPVGGATVVLRNLVSPDNQYRVLVPRALGPKFSATTTADGRWSLPNVPLTGDAGIVLDDPRFVSVWASARLGVKAGPTPVLVAKPASAITGKVVYEEGKPAAGVWVFAQSLRRQPMGQGEAVTGQDGAYRVDSLPPGEYTITVTDRGREWVAAAREGVAVAEAATQAVPDVVLNPGATIEGTVTDADTGAPVVGAYLYGTGPSRPTGGLYAETDGKGRYQLRVAPGQNAVSVSADSGGYLSPEREEQVTVAKGETATVNFQLKKGFAVSILATDAEGRPTAGAKVAMYGEDRIQPGFGRSGTTDTAGRVTIIGLPPGEYSFGTGGEWEMAEAQDIRVPASGEARVVLRKMALLSLEGRVVTATGEPVPEAAVQVQAMIQRQRQGGIGRRFDLTTDAEGRYSLSDLRSDAEPRVTATKEAYRYVSGGEVTKTEAGYEASDIVFARLGGSLRGKVVDSDGTPVAGVKVMSPTGDPHEQVITDAAGEFVLGKLPAGEVYLVAALGRATGSARAVPGGSPITITLKPTTPLVSQDLQRGFSLLWDSQRKSADGEYYARDYMSAELAPYDPDLALKLTEEPDGTVPDRTLQLTIMKLAEMRPARAVEWAPARLDLIRDAALRSQTALYLGLAVAGEDRELAARLYQQAKSNVDLVRPLPEECWSDLFTRVSLVALAGRLGEPDTEVMLQQLVASASAVAAKQGGDDRGLMAAVVKGMAKGSPELADQAMAYAKLEGKNLARARSRAIQEIASYDPVTAYQRLLQLEPKAGDESEAYAYGAAARSVIAAIGKMDPDAALALARKLTGDRDRAQGLAIAAGFQPPPAAAKAFREAAQLATYPGLLARVAAMAYQKDTALGKELFAQAHAALGKSEEGRRRDSTSEFAFYYARVEPGESRLLLESSFAAALQKEGGESGYFSLTPPLLAMAAVDMDRALEMARAIPDSESGARFDSQRKLAQYILAPESVRRTMPFDRWTASDTWMPGTPSGW